MESPPSFSTLSEAPALSEDSGLLITSGSFSSDSASGWHHIASDLQESDFDDRSLSLCESAETSERICGDYFNTVKKGPAKVVVPTIEPPPEFQDNPQVNLQKSQPERTSTGSCKKSEGKAKTSGLDIATTSRLPPRRLHPESAYDRRQCLNSSLVSPRLLHLSPCRGARPASRSSLSSRRSSSHNSLVTQLPTDDSSFITQAISHDALSAPTSDITDMYNVPFDSDIYAVPVDVVRPAHELRRTKKSGRTKKRGKSTPQNIGMSNFPNERNNKPRESKCKEQKSKRHSLPGSSGKKSCTDSDSEPVHLTLREMRRYLQTLYSGSSDSECRSTAAVEPPNGVFSVTIDSRQANSHNGSSAVFLTESSEVSKAVETNNNHSDRQQSNKKAVIKNAKSKKQGAPKDSSEVDKNEKPVRKMSSMQKKLSPVKVLSLNLKQSLCNLFRWRHHSGEGGSATGGGDESRERPAATRRALPPLPMQCTRSGHRADCKAAAAMHDFATSIQKVKDYGWYWGPITVEAAEQILSREPDGSFIVRDSSDDHYIFTLTFKLNGLRHVRIEHDQGNFCFGGCTMFKASTIVEFIESAVETSRSGRYLFFLNLRPMLGPVRVQLLYPVSRFKTVQSLQHMCRFVILKNVRRDLISSLPLPRRLLDYLNSTHYFAEMLSEI